jgi:hypothetical protein
MLHGNIVELKELSNGYSGSDRTDCACDVPNSISFSASDSFEN